MTLEHMVPEQDVMEDLLYESIESKWDNEQLPNLIEVIKEARSQFNLGLLEAMNVSKSMFRNRRSDLEIMGYEFSLGTDPTPPKYEG